MNNMLRRITAILLCMVLVMGILPAASAATLKLTKQPTDQTTKAGGRVTFAAAGNGVKSYTWFLVSPDGSQEFRVAEIGDHFPGAKVVNPNKREIILKNIPAEMNGWRVYVRIQAGSNTIDSDYAHIWITGLGQTTVTETEQGADGIVALPEVTPVPEATEEPAATAEPTADPNAKIITGVNVTLSADGYASGTEIDFTGKRSINVKVTCKFTPDYWVINGVRYDFKTEPKTIKINGLSTSITIEAVRKGKKSQTLLSTDDIQAARTGETLTVTSSDASMCFVNKNGSGSGGWFTRFDFTNDFKNKATKKTENGGRITLRVRASVPEGKGVSYYTFLGARWYFGSNVTQFLVTNLNTSMRYGVGFYDLPLCTVTCVGCTFTGGGYTNATSGTVYQGTYIKVNSNYANGYGNWTGLYNSSTVQSAKKSVSFTVHKSGTITFTPTH